MNKILLGLTAVFAMSVAVPAFAEEKKEEKPAKEKHEKKHEKKEDKKKAE
jgi:ribosomal protein L12E/L44/L45/RPP1/RPP2